MHWGKLRVWVLTLLFSPWLIYKFIQHGGFITSCYRTNPGLRRGGLPLASKLTRHGEPPLYAPTRRLTDASPHPFEEQPPYIVKPLYGSKSHNINKVTTLPSTNAWAEPMIIQPFIDGEEYTINIDATNNEIDCYAITHVGGTDEPWRHQPTHTDVTDDITAELIERCEEAADQINLVFGRFDVKTPSLDALKEGRFTILEANGPLSLNLTLYTDQSFTEHIKTFKDHWQRFFNAADKSTLAANNQGEELINLLKYGVRRQRFLRVWDDVDND